MNYEKLVCDICNKAITLVCLIYRNGSTGKEFARARLHTKERTANQISEQVILIDFEFWMKRWKTGKELSVISER